MYATNAAITSIIQQFASIETVRTFPQWNYRTLNLHAMKTDDFETNEPLETTVLQILKQMLQLGVHISKQVSSA